MSNLLNSTNCYLSGPMDFVGSRIIEKYLGWRSIMHPILKSLNINTLDPWNKPKALGLGENYGNEGVFHTKKEYEDGFWKRRDLREKFGEEFWKIYHIDLRMVDYANFLISFCPTNIYSVGTVHEIVMARGQHKPVMFVSPPVSYDMFDNIKDMTDEQKNAVKFYGLKENLAGLPSQWYGPLVGGNYMFDGFGFENTSFLSDNFYEEVFNSLSENVFLETKEDVANLSIVQDFIAKYEPLKKLKGSLIHNIKFANDEEKDLFFKEIEKRKTEYFWYNKPYKSIRPMLFTLLSIAAGIIPTVKVNETKEGYMKDDSWLILDNKGE
jgi:hypothetical protein